MEQSQVREEIDDLLLAEVPAACRPVRRQVERPKLLLEPLCIGARREQEDDLARGRNPRVHELADATRDVAGLGAAPMHPDLARGALVGDEQLECAREGRPRGSGGRLESLELVAELCCEELVDRGEHLGPRPVISRQWEDGAGCRAALPEHSHVGVAEAVDRLELVADDEEVSPGPLREEVEQLGLETVRVLKLVDHDRAEALARALADLLVAAEQIARTELEILEVECSFARLRLAVLRGELCEQLLEEPPVACRELLQRRGDGGLARLDERRRARPAGLHLRQGEQPLGQGRGGQKVEHALGGAALKLGRARIVDEAEGSLAQVRHALVEPGARSRLEHEVPAGRAKSCVDADEHLPQPRRAVRREQAPAVGLVRRAEPLERGRERLRLHHESLRLVEHAECRVDPCGERMGAEQASAEAVDRRLPRPRRARAPDRGVRAPADARGSWRAARRRRARCT